MPIKSYTPDVGITLSCLACGQERTVSLDKMTVATCGTTAVALLPDCSCGASERVQRPDDAVAPELLGASVDRRRRAAASLVRELATRGLLAEGADPAVAAAQTPAGYVTAADLTGASFVVDPPEPSPEPAAPGVGA